MSKLSAADLQARQHIDESGGSYFILNFNEESCPGLTAIPTTIAGRLVGTIFGENEALEDVSAISGLITLQRLYLKGSAVETIEFRNLQNLLELDLTKSKLRSLDGIESNGKKLWYLCLYGTKVSDITPLKNLKKLKFLRLDHCPIADLSALAGLKMLRTISLQNTQVTDISPLADLPRLAELDLIGTRVRDLRPLSGTPSLKTISLSEEMTIPDQMLPLDCPNLEIEVY